MAVVALLAVSNVMSNEVLPGWAYLPWNLAMTAVLLVLALMVDRTGLPPVGFDPATWRRGLAVGGAVMGVIALALVLGALLPPFRGLYDDARVGDVSARGMAYQVLVRIPFGTVVMEEVAFRGVLLGMLLRRTSTARAVAGSSALFGLWHVLPAIGIEGTNPVLGDVFTGTAGAVLAVVLAVVGTALAGVVFCVVRLAGRHLLAPVMMHLGTNSVAFLVSWLVIRWT